jgi:dCTP deaminase
MLLARAEILDLLNSGSLKFDPPINEEQIGICSIDLRLGVLLSKFKDIKGVTVMPSLSESASFFDREEKNAGDKIHLNVNEFILTRTYEKVFLPNTVAAMVEGRSTYARWGLSAHVTAPLIEPLFFGNITLEMYNHGKFALDLIVGEDTVCQLILYIVTSSIPQEVSDAFGRYKGQTSPEPKPYK